jgi:hypothetical protein
MKILQKEITGTQTSFPTHFDGETEFHPVFPFSLQKEITGTQTSFSTHFDGETEFHPVFPFS